jgi:hypothetical protein
MQRAKDKVTAEIVERKRIKHGAEKSAVPDKT